MLGTTGLEEGCSGWATVQVYYESRLAQLALDDWEKPLVGPEFEGATKGEEVERQEKLEIAAEEARALLSERRAAVEKVDTIPAAGEDMSDSLTSEITESRPSSVLSWSKYRSSPEGQ